MKDDKNNLVAAHSKKLAEVYREIAEISRAHGCLVIFGKIEPITSIINHNDDLEMDLTVRLLTD